jgi:predicted nucleic acid-binding protein
MTKAYRLMTKTGVKERLLSRILHRELLLNSDKCQRLTTSDIKPIPQNLQTLVDTGQVDADDYYLFQIYCSVQIDLLITTDVRLQEVLHRANIQELRIQHRNDFLKEYLK